MLYKLFSITDQICNQLQTDLDQLTPKRSVMSSNLRTKSDNSTNFLGHTGDKYFCAPGLAWHQRLLQCDWPYNLDESEPCYQPLN